MPITESLGAHGQWSLQLTDSTPRRIRDAVKDFGHITIHTGRVEPALVGEGLLASSRYTGVVLGAGESDDGFSLTGCGMEFWLGDQENKGAVIEEPVTFTAQTYTQTVRDLIALAPAVVEGTLHAVAGTYSGTHQFQVVRTAVAYVAQTGGVEYRVNGDTSVDLGTTEQLYVTDPKCLVVKRGAGVDGSLRALLGNSAVTSDVEDFTTRVLLLAQSTDTQIVTATADIDPGLNPYKDLHGNPVKLTRMVSESSTDSTNAEARAQLQLNRFTGKRDALTLSTNEYDINGSVRIGDYLWVFNPDIKLVDEANEVTFRGQMLNPVKLRLHDTTWPVSPGFMVAYRDPDGVWIDLTDYVKFEGGQTTLTVGGYNRSLTNSGTEPIGRIPQPDSSVPGVTTWNTPFRVGVYQSQVTGAARGDVILDWNQPTNTDATPIVDGSHYEIRFRQATIPFYPVTYGDISDTGMTYGDITASGATWGHPIVYPETEWQTVIAPFDTTVFRLQELTPAMPYEAQIRAVDLATPTNVGAWSGLALWQTTNDNIPPQTPAPPEVAANPMAVQMTHRLGVAAGGGFNLDGDLHHLELHGGPEPLFTADDTTLLGKVLANYGMVLGEIPVVQTFQITAITPVYFKVIAVDEAGNKSLASEAVPQTAELIDDQYISSLTVSKLTAGTMTANMIVGGRIATMPLLAAPGVEMDDDGIRGYNPLGQNLLEWKSNSGKLIVNGTGGIEINDGRLVVRNAAGNIILELGECADGRHGVQVYKDDGTRVSRMGELASGTEGMEVVDDLGNLVRVSTLAFGTAAASVTATQDRIGTTYGDMVTPGPACTVTVGSTLRCLVTITAFCLNTNSGGGTARAGFDINGPSGYFVAAQDLRSVGGFWSGLGYVQASSTFLITGLPQIGSYTFTMKYTSASGTLLSQFAQRHIVAQPF